GNVWEWVQDWKGDYPSGSVTDPKGPSSGSLRVTRGGSWYYDAWVCRSADRDGGRPGYRNGVLGFRLVLSPGQ
ncbi:MAG: SUMF1/EgtB/PvdO family nonheme iron enzyme, partial [Gammaproteobacteria bacterium]|nr:SUMF1/EgtB/PvdO family nonheme iron enzyme [Gammaproteobacteria bacterium]